MKIEKICVGTLKANCYILDINNEVLLVDPGSEYDKINSKINGRKILGILITHSHFDHIGALDEFKDISVYSYSNLEEKEYKIGNFTFDVIYNPGHSNDSISFYFKEEKVLFSGDFLFYHTIGRCDLPMSNYSDMLKSIEKIKKYPKDITVYPGHGKETTIEEEINNNMFFNL